MDTITLQLSPNLGLTLAALNRAVIVNLFAQLSDAIPPDLPPGYTHEDALKIDEYKAAFDAYQARVSSDGSMRVLGAARLAAVDFIGDEKVAQEEVAFMRFCKRYGLTNPDRDDPLTVGYAIYAAAQVAPSGNVESVFEFLFRALGVPAALVAEERKSENGSGRGETVGRSRRANKKGAESPAR